MAINFYSDIHLNANKLGRDADNLLDFSTDNEITFRVGAGDGVVFKASGEIEATKFDGALEGNADTATVATTVTATINENASENNVITFLANAEAETGNHYLEFDDSLTYNPSSGTLTAARFTGNLTGSSSSCTGNAATATALATARTIGGVSFDGTANIILPGVNAEGNQNTNGNAATATTATKLQMTVTGTNSAGAVGGGEIVYFGGETSIAAGKIVHYNSSGNWELSDPNSATTSDGLLGVALGSDASVNGVLLKGIVTIDHDPGAIGDLLYLSAGTTGTATSTPPSGSGDIVRTIGYQINHASNGEIFFNPSTDYITLA